jgi:hypothetical protein
MNVIVQIDAIFSINGFISIVFILYLQGFEPILHHLDVMVNLF